jgi:hypothetical protein
LGLAAIDGVFFFAVTKAYLSPFLSPVLSPILSSIHKSALRNF